MSQENGLQQMLDGSREILKNPAFLYAPDGRIIAITSGYPPSVHWHWKELLSLVAVAGVNPVALLMIPAYWACTPMLLWIGPIFLFSYGYGYYKPTDVLKYGSLPTVIMVVLMAFAPYYTRAAGIITKLPGIAV